MTSNKLQYLSDLISVSDPSITIKLRPDKLILQTDKNEWWKAFIVIGFLFSILLFFYYDRAEYNLKIGLIVLTLSLFKFWEIQNINKIIVIDTEKRMFSIIPKNRIYRWAMTNIYKIQLIFSLDHLPDFKIIKYQDSKYHWTHRIYYKAGFWTFYILEFDKKDTAQQVLDALTK